MSASDSDLAEPKLISDDIKNIAASLSDHYKTTQKVFLSLCLTFLFAMLVPNDGKDHMLLGIEVDTKTAIPLAIIAMYILTYNYCIWFTLSFKLATIFNELVSAEGGQNLILRGGISRKHEVLHLLYFSTIFRSFPLFDGLPGKKWEKIGNYFRNVSGWALVLVPIILIFIAEFYRSSDIQINSDLILLPFIALAAMGTLLLNERQILFREMAKKIKLASTESTALNPSTDPSSTPK